MKIRMQQRMAPETTTTVTDPGGGVAGVVTVPTTTTTTAIAPDAGGGADEPAQPSKREWADYRKEQRETQKKLDANTTALAALVASTKTGEKPKATETKTAPTADEATGALRVELDGLKSRQAFQDALDETDVPLTKPQRKRLQSMFGHDKPEDAGEWLASALADLGIEKPKSAPTAATAPAPRATPAQAQTRSDTGPPGATHGEIDLDKITGDALRAMPEDQRRKLYLARDAKQGARDYNPLTKTIPGMTQ